MEELEIYLDRIETDRDENDYFTHRRVVFRVRQNDETFEVPIVLGFTIAEDAILSEARLKLHRIVQGMLVQTTKWTAP